MKPTSLFKISGLYYILTGMMFFVVDIEGLYTGVKTFSGDLDVLGKLIGFLVFIIGVIIYNISHLIKNLKKAINIVLFTHLTIVGAGVYFFYTGSIQKLGVEPFSPSIVIRFLMQSTIIGLYINALRKLKRTTSL